MGGTIEGMKTIDSDGRVLRLEIAPATIVWIVGAAAGLWLLYTRWMVVLILVVALIFVGMANPVIVALEARGLKRMQALLLLLGVLVFTSTLAIFLTAPPLLEQLSSIIHDLPSQRLRLIALLGKRSLTAPFGIALRDLMCLRPGQKPRLGWRQAAAHDVPNSRLECIAIAESDRIRLPGRRLDDQVARA